MGWGGRGLGRGERRRHRGPLGACCWPRALARKALAPRRPTRARLAAARLASPVEFLFSWLVHLLVGFTSWLVSPVDWFLGWLLSWLVAPNGVRRRARARLAAARRASPADAVNLT